MSFFADRPRHVPTGTNEAEVDHRRRVERTRNIRSTTSTSIPGVLPVEPVVLAQTNDIAIALTCFHVYRTGIAFTLALRFRSSGQFALLGPELHRRVARPGTFNSHVDETDDNLPADVLRFGVQLPDGSKATNIDEWPPGAGQDVSGPLLVARGGGGGQDHYHDFRQWLFPLPSTGPLVFVCTWPSYGIGENSWQIEAERVNQAAEHNIEL